MRDLAVERLFSLFTTSDRAVAIAGDLAEEGGQRGHTWFWLQVVRITVALWRNATTEAPLQVLALMLTGLALLIVPALGGVAAVFVFPHAVDAPFGWIGLPLFWWGGALVTGASLVFFAPRRGMAASALLAMSGAALLTALGGPAVWRDPSNTDFVIFCTTGLLATMPLVAGAAVARQRWLPETQ